MTRGVFITGTDTGVGKTAFACALLRRCSAAGSRAVGMKPVAAGGGWANGDIAALAEAGNVEVPLSLRCSYAFDEAIAPHLAARGAGVVIDLRRIRESYDALSNRADSIVVEGAGGALVPLGERSDMLDIARALDLPVVLVVGVRLGCLNHAMLASLAIRARGLDFAGWVANSIDGAMDRRDENIAELDRRLPAPRLASVRWGCADAPEWSASNGASQLFASRRSMLRSPGFS
jgi:dethiobiotin synthetase